MLLPNSYAHKQLIKTPQNKHIVYYLTSGYYLVLPINRLQLSGERKGHQTRDTRSGV